MAKNGVALRRIAKGNGRLSGPTKSYEIYTEGQTACSVACPAGVNIKAYVNLIADRKYEDAVRVIRRDNPFPGICGRICTHPCEAECGRKDVDQPVSIRALKRFAADYELSRKRPGIATKISHSEKVAIVGSGPAGLTAASDLALAGFHVTVFDSAKEPGGLLAWGIPDFRLPKNIVRSEIRDIEALGVEIVTGKKIEMPTELLKKGYSAVILATGCQVPMLARIKSEDAALDCLVFLRRVSEGDAVKLGKKVTVVGGGNAALDSARTALRLGADVTVAYRRTEEQMPADTEEIDHAKEEGVKFEFLAIPVGINPGKSVSFQRATLGEPDGTGRRSPVPVPDDFFEIQADSVIMAIGSRADVTTFPRAMKLKGNGTPEIDGNGMTSVAGIFAAGDLATGPLTIVDAIGSGHVAAAGVMGYLSAETVRDAEQWEMLVVEAPPSAEARRCGTCYIPLDRRTTTFDEAELGMEEREAITEALRCRRCGGCSVCDACLAVCDYRNAAITLPDTGESALAKVPFEVAAEAIAIPENWTIDIGKSQSAARIEPLLARTDEALCIACGKCEEACPYKAIRTVFEPNGGQHAVVELSACRGCGACAAACPTGAMEMGWLDDSAVFPALWYAVGHSAGNNGIVRFSCIWNTRGNIEHRPWEVKVQCTRRISPAMLMEALAGGARAVSVVGCNQDECHYLPGPWMGPDTVDATKAMLTAVGISPARVSYIDSPDCLETVFRGISGLKRFQSFEKGFPDVRAGLGRCLNAAQVLMAQPDHVGHVKADTLLGYGCLAVSEPAFAAYGLQDADILGAAMDLLKAAGVEYEMAAGAHTSGAKLGEWGMDGLQRAYIDNLRRCLRESGAGVLMVPTPNCYESLSKMNLGCKVVSLPSVLKERLKGRFPETDETAAYHPACSGTGAFDRDCLELLELMPGRRIVTLEGKCGDTGWRDANAESGRAARNLLKKAGDAGIAVLVAGSPRCAAHLRSVTLGWNTGGVKVTDIYTFLASRLGGEA